MVWKHENSHQMLSSGVSRYDKEPIFQNNLLFTIACGTRSRGTQGVLCRENTGRGLLIMLTLAAGLCELDGKANEPGKRYKLQRTSTTGWRHRKKISEISSPE